MTYSIKDDSVMKDGKQSVCPVSPRQIVQVQDKFGGQSIPQVVSFPCITACPKCKVYEFNGKQILEISCMGTTEKHELQEEKKPSSLTIA
jgi:hypothetical protein